MDTGFPVMVLLATTTAKIEWVPTKDLILRTLQELNHLSLIKRLRKDSIIIPILQMCKLRQRVKQDAQRDKNSKQPGITLYRLCQNMVMILGCHLNPTFAFQGQKARTIRTNRHSLKWKEPGLNTRSGNLHFQKTFDRFSPIHL